MALLIDDKTTAPKTAASSALHPAQGNEVEKKKTKVAKEPKLEGPFVEARKNAADGAKKVSTTAAKSSGDGVPGDGVNKVINDGIEASKSAGREISKKGAEFGSRIADITRPVTKAVLGPTVNEVKEAGGEIKGAWDKAQKDSKFDKSEIDEIQKSDLDGFNKNLLVGKEYVEEFFQREGRNIKNVGKLGWEVGEGIVETVIHNPVTNATVAGAKGLWGLKDDVGGWFQDRGEDVVSGAKAAGSTWAKTQAENITRSKEQGEENLKEIGDSAKDTWSSFGDAFSPNDSDEVEEIRNSDLSGFNKDILVFKEQGEEVVEGLAGGLFGIARTNYEMTEGVVQSGIAEVQNFGNSVAGGFESAGDFVGGLFD